jgi:ABC-type sugar transport system ATPase subunit
MQTTTPTTAPALEVQGLSIGYEDHTIFEGLDLAIEAGSVTTLIGANGCGKSTLLRGLSRLLKPSRGEVLLQGTPLRTRSTKAIAAELAFLPQKPVTPVSTSVRELVSRGRYPHRKAWELHGGEHHRIVDAALQALHISNQNVIYALAPSARSRINAVYMTGYFIGASLGSAMGSAVWLHWGWTGASVAGLILSLATLAVVAWDRSLARQAKASA